MENNFLNTILHLDRELLIYLNNLGSEQWDSFWLVITNKNNWIPLCVFIIYLNFKKFHYKKAIFTVLFIVIVLALADQFTNLAKWFFERTRPCNLAEIQDRLRQFEYRPRGFSFWSGHAFVSTSFTVFCIQLFKKRIKWIYLMILFPVVFGYSRIYLRVHYPLDVFSGYVMGTIYSLLFFWGYNKLSKFIFESKR